MTPARVNPFRPTSPVNPGMFVGRVPELKRLESALVQTRAANPKGFLITGERGIGKTSLLDYIKWTASGEFSLMESQLRFLVAHVDVEQTTTRFTLIKKLERAITVELAKTEAARTFLKTAWAFLSRVEAAGVSLKESSPHDEESLLDEFAYSLAETVTRVVQSAEDDLFKAHTTVS